MLNVDFSRENGRFARFLNKGNVLSGLRVTTRRNINSCCAERPFILEFYDTYTSGYETLLLMLPGIFNM